MDMTHRVPEHLTLYVNRLPERPHSEVVKSLLYDLFVPFGQIIDIVIKNTLKKKGQAFIVFIDARAGAVAKKAMDGQYVLNHPIRVEFAKSPSRSAEIYHGVYAPRPARKFRVPGGVPMSLALGSSTENSIQN